MSLCAGRAFATLLLLAVWTLSDVAWAQVTTHITPTTTPALDLGTEVDAVGTTIHITGGTRPEGGTNLFHSFDFFTVGTNDIAHFQNDMMLPTTNIIARVIGDAAGLREASTIDGILRTNNPLDAIDPLNFGAANLYLVNPAGVIFGPNGQLDIKGSFAATTADYLRMADGALFHTDLGQPSVLTIADVASFGFTSPQPVAITLEGSTLRVATQESLSIVGGDFTMTGGSLTAPGGRIQIASVASSGEVIPSEAAQLAAVDVSSFSRLGSAAISGTSAAFATLSVSSLTDPTVGAGTVLVRANQFTANRTAINATTGSTNAAPIGIDLQVTDTIRLATGSSIITTANGAGRAGDIRIETDMLQLDTSLILARAIAGTGDGGTIDINASLVDLRNNGSLQTFTQTGGQAGNITVRADRLEMRDGGRSISGGLGTGSGGIINVVVNDLFGSAQNLANVPNCAACFTGIQAQAGFGSRGGSVQVQADSIQLLDGAGIQSQLFSIGPGANIDVSANDILLSGSVTVAGPSGPVTQFATIGSILSGSFAQGRGGNVTVDAQNIEIANNGRIINALVSGAPGTAGNTTINTGTLNIHDRGGVFASSFLGTGNSGDISINADSVTISGLRGSLDPGGVADFTGLSASTAIGRGGTIRVTTDDLLVTNKGAIASTTFASGAAGSINITAADVSVTDAGFITASTGGSGAGGSIDINAGHVMVSGEIRVPGALDAGVAAIAAQARAGSGNAGTIKITADEIDVLNKGIINNDTLTSGIGGSIELKAGLLTVANSGLVSAATRGTGNAGSITLNTNVASLSNAGQVTNSSVGTATGRAGIITVQGLDGAGSSAQSISLTGANTSITSDTDNTGRGGDIQIRAGQVQLADLASLTATTSGTGRAGSIGVTSDNLSVTGGARIEASTQGAGNAGNITITNADTVSVAGLSSNGSSRSGIFAKTQTSGGTAGGGSGGGSGGAGGGSGGGGGQTSTAGNAGNINIRTNNLLLSGGAQIDSSTTTSGSGGSLSVNADAITITGTNTSIKSDASRGNGTGGDIELTARTIGIHDKASVTAATDGSGNAGGISMSASERFMLDSAAIITTSTRGSGSGGMIRINSPQVLLDGLGTSITASTLRPFADLAVTLNIEHPNDGDLTVRLDSPDGTRVALLSRAGGSGDNFTGTILDDQATQPITSGTAPFTGTFTPREPLAQLIDQIVAGTWKLNVNDQVAGNTGSPQNLQSWSLRVGDQVYQSTSIPRIIPDNGSVSSNLVVTGPAGAVIQGVGEAPGVGGDITINAGTVAMQNGATLSATTQGSGRGGTVNVNATGLVALAGTGTGLFTDSEASGGSGNINVAASSMTMDNGAKVSAASSGTGDAGNITVTAPGNTVGLASGSSITSSTTGAGNAGQVIVTTPALILDDATITTSTSSSGNAGGITANVGFLTLTNAAEISSSSTGAATGAAGSVTIQGLVPHAPADVVTVTNSSLRTSADSTGRGGSITVDAINLTLNGATISASVKDVNTIDVTDSPTFGIGNIALTSSTMNMTDGTVTAETSGLRNAGTITLTTTGNTLNMDGGSITSSTTSSGTAGQILVTSPVLSLNNGTITTSTSSSGNAGGITVNAGSVAVQNGGELSSSSAGTGAGGTLLMQGLAGAGSQAASLTITGAGSGLFSTSSGSGAGGSITAHANQMTISNGGTVSAASTGSGNAGSITMAASGPMLLDSGVIATSAQMAQGGDITLTSSNSVTLQDHTLVSASSQGAGNAGSITINAGQQYLSTNSAVTTQAAHASGGDITVNAQDMIRLINSQINTSVAGGTTTLGGNITIDPQFVILQNSQILAKAFAGTGGNITITSNVFLADPSSLVDASSQLGISGSINILSPVQNVGGELTALTQEFSSAAALLAQQCAARATGGTFSTFVVAAREGLPVEPGGFLASPSLTSELLGSRLSGRDPQTQLPAITGLFPTYDARPIQLAKFGDSCHR